MSNTIIRSNGITTSEKYLQALCERSFLRLWSYPGVFRDQSNGGGAKGGKEVCDLLVVFENHILIFSDKNISFPNTGDLNRDWSRWFRKAVLESGEQLFGAERWIKNYPDRLFTDRDCKQKFPIDLPDMSDAIFHRIIVAHGASERCRYEYGGRGSLMILSRIIGKDHLLNRLQGGIPFAVGQIDPSRGFVHILDDTSLEIILRTLDTIKDFIAYLEKKEGLFEKLKNVGAAGEEELLAYYLRNINNDGEHDFLINDEDAIYIDEGFWNDFIQSPQRKAQIDADKISYLWDSLIEEFSTHIFNNTQYYAEPSGVRNQERIMRFLAREPRTERRMLAESLVELIEKTPKSKIGTRLVLPLSKGDPYHLFLLFPRLENMPESEYRELRRNLLLSYCLVVKLDFSNAQDIVGIAMEKGNNINGSEDAIYFDARNWTIEQENQAKSLKEDLDLLKNTKMYKTKEYEYPIDVKKPRKHHKAKKK